MSDLSDDNDRMSLSDADEPREHQEQKENADEDGTGRRIDPSTSKKKMIRRPLPKLDLVRLKGPKGLRTIEKYFEGFKFNGHGHEAADLDRIMKRLEHWAHRLYPKYRFDDFLEKVEHLASKKELQTYLTKYRRDLLTDDQVDEGDDDIVEQERYKSPEPVDEFDMLIAEQIEKTRQATSQTRDQSAVSQNVSKNNVEDIDDEVKKRMERNRQIALERKMARIKKPESADSQINASQVGNSRPVTFAGPDDDLDMLIEEEMNNSSASSVKKLTQEASPLATTGKIDEAKRNDEEEIKKKIERNRQLALERKMARLKQKEVEQTASQFESTPNSSENMQTSLEMRTEGDDATILNKDEVITKTSEVYEAREDEMAAEEDVNSKKTSNVPVTAKPTVKANRLLTDQELDDEIGAAVRMFIRGNRSSN